MKCSLKDRNRSALANQLITRFLRQSYQESKGSYFKQGKMFSKITLSASFIARLKVR